MEASTKRASFVISLLVLGGAALWLALPNVASSASSVRLPGATQKQIGGLDSERRALLEKLSAELRAGAPFAEEEKEILRRFAAGDSISDLEADVLISRALYDRFIAGKQLSKQQETILDRYTQSVARRARDIADRKNQALNLRIAAAAAAGPSPVPLVAPANDTCAGAEVIPAAGPFPYLTAVTANITDATSTGDPPLPSCQTNVSRSIWYKFTPSATANYTIATCADSPTGTTVDDTVMAIYTSSGTCGGPFTELPLSDDTLGCDDDSCFSESFQSTITTELNAGTQYYIVVWEFGSAPPTAGNTAVQLRVTRLSPPVNDTCATATPLGLNAPKLGTTVGAGNDYQLSGSACFTGIGQIPSTASGHDVAYVFTAPTAGNYSFRVTGYDINADLVMYVASSCPAGTSPVTVSTCLAASNRDVTGTAEELKCVALTSSQVVYVFVDENSHTEGNSFTIEVTRCSQETEPNDTPATANALTLPALGIEGAIASVSDKDFYSLGTVAANSRIFAMVDGVAAGTKDFDLRVTTTTDTLEFDDLDNDPQFGNLSPNVEGTPSPNASQAVFLRVDSLVTGSEPYRVYAVVQPPGANAGCNCSATNETEPNNTTAQANSAGNNYFYAALAGPSPSTDADVYSFTAQAGGIVFLGLDGDPVRNNTPLDAQIELLDSSGATLIMVNDADFVSSTTTSPGTLAGTTPFSPGEALVYRIRTTGTYYARVTIGASASGAAASGDYLLSISVTAPTAAKLSDEDLSSASSASSYESGVSLKWRTGLEVDNLGFNVYRQESAGGNRVRLNPQVIAGSALTIGPFTALSAGRSYAWFDNQRAKPGTRYWIESLDINGQGSMHGPIKAGPAIGIFSPAKSATLADSASAGSQATQSGVLQRTAGVSLAGEKSSAVQSSLAGQPAVKLAVNAEGVFRVTQPELVAAGFDPNVDPSTLQVFADGREQAVNVTQAGSRLDPSAAIEFYGLGIDSPVTGDHVYWVSAGTQPGKRMAQLAAGSNKSIGGSFLHTVELRERTFYVASIRNADKENFFGAIVGGNPVDQVLNVQHLDTASSGGGMLEVALQGLSAVPHQVEVQINGTRAGALTFNGQDEGVARLAISQKSLREGANTVRLVAQGGGSDVSLVSWVRLSYWHTLVADNNQLRFTTDSKKLSIDGFNSPAIRVFDVTDPGSVKELIGTIKSGKNFSYSVNLNLPGAGQRTLFATTDAAFKRVAGATANQPSNWRQPSAAANLIVITRRDCFSAIAPLVNLRTAQGYQVALIDVEDVYDEFSFGNKSPHAIKDFLEYAYVNWRVRPGFVILAGDASFDPRNYRGLGAGDLVPTKLVDTQTMQTACDDWFADFDADGLPELAIGRLPVRNASEASAVVSKIVGYDRSFRSPSALLVADADGGHDFQVASRELRDLIPAQVRTEEVYRGMLDPSAARTQLLDALNRGQRVVNYNGHGNATGWRSGLLTSEDALALNNAENLSLFVMMTCLNGYFDDPQTDSLAESLMRAPRGGAIAVWASSGMTSPGEQSVMDLEMFRRLFDGIDSWTIGEAVSRAKAAVRDGDVRRTWILFGDPTTRVR